MHEIYVEMLLKAEFKFLSGLPATAATSVTRFHKHPEFPLLKITLVDETVALDGSICGTSKLGSAHVGRLTRGREENASY